MRHACSTPNIHIAHEDTGVDIEVDTRQIPPITRAYSRDCFHYEIQFIDGVPYCEKVPWTRSGLVCLALCALAGLGASFTDLGGSM